VSCCKVPDSGSGTTYTPPPGIDATLTVSGSTATLTYNNSQEVLDFTALSGCTGLAMTSDTDRNGNNLTYTYSGCYLSSITLTRSGQALSTGRTWSVTTNSYGRITSISESNFDGGLDHRCRRSPFGQLRL
jgi:hypothetical protein